jgi:hypothetical protein
MEKRYKSDYCFTNKDLFENMKWDKLNLPQFTHKKRHKDTRTEYVTDVFMRAFNMILLDIIENNVTFVLPLFGNKEACFHVKKIDGDAFKRARQNGAFEGIDFLKSNFCGYLVNFQYTTSYGLGEKPIHLSPALKEKFYNNINNGKQYY